jgi:predicted outer membrane protein
VRDFARALERDLSERNQRLARLAREQRGTDGPDPVPGASPHEVPFKIREFHRLRVLSGPAFDKQYLNFAIIGYENAIRGYTAEAKSPGTEAGAIAAEALPRLRAQLEQARKLLAEIEEERR